MNAAELVKWVRTELAAHADPAFREGVKNFFREPVDPYGVRSPEAKAIARAAGRELKAWPARERDRFADELWKSGRLEEASIAIGACRRFAGQCGAREFRLFERWIDRYVNNWANCDGVASWLLAAAIENEPELIGELEVWTRSKNRWKRRAAIVALLQEAKRGRHAEAIFDIAGRLLGDGDDMVQKGVGWVLKETYPKRPRDVLRFLAERGGDAPRLVLRLAAEKMTAADRTAVLERAASA